MEFNYRIMTIDRTDNTTHIIMTGLQEKDAIRQLKNFILCQDPNQPIMYAIDKYIPQGTVHFSGERYEKK